MASLFKTELDTIMASYTTSIIDNDGVDAINISSPINAFISESKSILIGKDWDLVRERFNILNSLMNNRKQLADDLSKSIQSAISLLNNYLGEYDYLDSSQLPQLYQERDNLLLNIQDMEIKMI